jgi:hypothetical protein
MQQQPFQGGGKPYQKDPETEKRITRMSVLKVAGDLVINGQVKLHDLTKVAQIFERYVMTGEDTIHGYVWRSTTQTSRNRFAILTKQIKKEL